MCEICLKLTIKIPERRQWRHYGVLLLTLNKLQTLSWCFHCWLSASKCQLGKSNLFCCVYRWFLPLPHMQRIMEFQIFLRVTQQCLLTFFFLLIKQFLEPVDKEINHACCIISRSSLVMKKPKMLAVWKRFGISIGWPIFNWLT